MWQMAGPPSICRKPRGLIFRLNRGAQPAPSRGRQTPSSSTEDSVSADFRPHLNRRLVRGRPPGPRFPCGENKEKSGPLPPASTKPSEGPLQAEESGLPLCRIAVRKRALDFQRHRRDHPPAGASPVPGVVPSQTRKRPRPFWDFSSQRFRKWPIFSREPGHFSAPAR